MKGFAVALGCAAALGLAPPAMAAMGDFGDAPDGSPAYDGVAGHFPALKGSRGPRHAHVGALRLGHGESAERNSRQVDVDQLDDGFSAELAACKVSHVYFVVDATRLPARLRKGHLGYLNAWFDWNRDGGWGGASACGSSAAPEWAVRNVAIPLSAVRGSTTHVFRVDVLAGPKATDVWQRATLTLDQKVRSQGARRGRFRYGETEDYGPQGDTPGLKRPAPSEPPVTLPEDKPYAICRDADVLTGWLGPPGMPAFMDHGDLVTMAVQVFSRNGNDKSNFGTVTVTAGAPRVFGDKPRGIQSGMLFGAGPFPWTADNFLLVRSTAVDRRKNPFQLVLVNVQIKGPLVGTLKTTCPVIVAHDVLIPAGANTLQPPPDVTTTIDTTVGPPTITQGGQTGGGGGNGTTTVITR